MPFIFSSLDHVRIKDTGWQEESLALSRQCFDSDFEAG